MRLIGAAGSIRGDAVRIYGVHFVQLGVTLVASVLVARVLGPADKGVLDLFLLLQSFVAEFGMLGFNSGLLFYLANRARPIEEVHGTGVVFSLVVGTTVAFLGWLALPALTELLPGLPRWAILLALFTAPPLLYRILWSNLMVGINRAVQSYKVELATGVVTLGVLVALWLADALTYQSAIILFAGALVLHAMVGLAILLARGRGLRPTRRLTRESLRYGVVIYVGFLANVLHFKVDQAMVNAFLGSSSLGIYAIAVRWAETLFVLDSALISASLFRVSSGGATDSHRLTRRVFRAQLVISGATGLVLAAFAQPLVLLLYGEPYAGAVLPMIILIPGVVAWSLAKVLSQHIVYNRGKQWIPTAIAVGGSGLNLGLNYLLIPRWGLNGAAGASMASYTLVLALTGVAFQWLKARES